MTLFLHIFSWYRLFLDMLVSHVHLATVAVRRDSCYIFWLDIITWSLKSKNFVRARAVYI